MSAIGMPLYSNFTGGFAFYWRGNLSPTTPIVDTALITSHVLQVHVLISSVLSVELVILLSRLQRYYVFIAKLYSQAIDQQSKICIRKRIK